MRSLTKCLYIFHIAYYGLEMLIVKSSGAALKKPRTVRLDHVIEYGELLRRYCDNFISIVCIQCR